MSKNSDTVFFSYLR